MRNGAFIFDCVVHMHNLSETNVLIPYGAGAQSYLYRMSSKLQPKGSAMQYRAFARKWSAQEIGAMLFERSEIDMAMAQTVPLFDYWEDGLASVERNYELAKMFPERVIFCGGVDPVFQGVQGAVRAIEYQITEMGARSIKFYNAHTRGRSWRCDDRSIAYPMYEKMLSLGCNVAQYHKGNPIGLEPMEFLQPYDLQQVAYDFPALNIIIHHLGLPWIDETMSIAARFPNVFLALSTWINTVAVQPLAVTERLGKLLYYCGPAKLVWGSETPIWHKPQLLLDMSWDINVPEDLQDGLGLPEITDADRRLIFGENMCRLLDIDVEAKRQELEQMRSQTTA